MSLTECAFWLVYCTGVLGALARPILGVVLYILVYHLNPEYQWWGDNVREMGLRTSLIIAFATMVGILIRQPRMQPGARQFTVPIVLAILLAALASLSLTFGEGTSPRGVYLTEKLAKILIFVLIMIRCVRTPADYQLVIYAWMLGVFYIGYQAWGNVGVRDAGRLSAGLGGADFAESSDLAVHLVASLPFIGAAFFMARRWVGRFCALAVGALAMNTIILTRTRNVVFGMAAMAAAMVTMLPRGYRIKGWAAVAAGGLLAIYLTDAAWWDRMYTIAHYKQDAAAMDRLRFWGAAIEMAHDHPFGIGAGNFQERVLDYVPGLAVVRSAHNTYLECLAELGVPGFCTLMLIIAVTMVRLRALARSVARDCPQETVQIGVFEAGFHFGWHVAALRAGLVGYLVCALFTTRLWTEDFWMLLAMAVCLANAYALATREQPEEEIALSPVTGVRQEFVVPSM